jgi:hypothetical protein
MSSSHALARLFSVAPPKGAGQNNRQAEEQICTPAFSELESTHFNVEHDHDEDDHDRYYI